jgi:bacillithiol biosynthesis cysteine-adding enzyme BshC
VYSECLSFARIPHTSKLFCDFLYDFDRVRRFYARPPHASEWLREEAGRVSYDPQRRARIADILETQNRRFGASAKVLDSIERFRRGALAAVTGQQVGFLGGPLFSILKALTAVRVSEQATHAGVDCVPIFWLATEDHDFEEIRSAVVQDPDGKLHTISLDAEHKPGAPVRDVRLPDTIGELIDGVVKLLGDSEAGEFVREAYRPGETVGTAFARLFARLFAEFGVIMLDASDPALHEIAAPLYIEAIRKAPVLDKLLLERGRELQSGGYHEQVKVTPASTLLFGTVDGMRVPTHLADGGFMLGDEKLDVETLISRISKQPNQFSPNVLLRPVVQDFLLPTLAYSGGPAEVAYFAQADVVYETLLGRTTPILPRFSATIVDPRAKRILDKYGLSLTDLFGGPEHIQELMAARSLPSDMQAAFDNATAVAAQSLADITEALKVLDPTLVRASARAGNRMRYELERLRKRAANAELRRSETNARHAAHLNSALLPHKQLQERVIAGISFVARFGPSLLHSLYEAAQRDCLDHQIVYM